ncbi:MAG TPA: hypothetical protein VEV20_14600 [Burkholderiales bacterium]|nr:hypothetical protein [Burkholderiales bacterium]
MSGTFFWIESHGTPEAGPLDHILALHQRYGVICAAPDPAYFFSENRFRLRIGVPSGFVPTISCVAPGGRGVPSGTASPRVKMPRSNFSFAAAIFSGVIGGSWDATEGGAAFFALV